MVTPTPRQLAWIIAAACSVGLTACGGGGDTGPTDVPLVFPASPLIATASDGGNYTVELRSSPQPPVRGSDAVEMRLTDAGGAPATGLAITVVPWMPAHGHGTSVQPTVTEMEPGVYVATPVYLYMAGAWQLRTTIAGAVDDQLTPTVDVP